MKCGLKDHEAEGIISRSLNMNPELKLYITVSYTNRKTRRWKCAVGTAGLYTLEPNGDDDYGI